MYGVRGDWAVGKRQMEKLEIVFKFEGLLADEAHALDGSDGVAFHESARQLLALHAHFYTIGEVPNGGAVNHTRQYRILETASRKGSIEFSYIVEVYALSAVQAVGYGTGAIVFKLFFADSLQDMLQRGRDRIRRAWVKDDTVLESQAGNHEPIVDIDLESAMRWRRLQERGTSGLVGTLRPLGRSAEVATIYVGDCSPIAIGQSDLEKLRASMMEYRERQVTDAIKVLKLSNKGLH